MGTTKDDRGDDDDADDSGSGGGGAMDRTHEVIVIGAGTTGAAAAYHLANHGVRNILVLDMGSVGKGSSTPGLVPTSSTPSRFVDGTISSSSSRSRIAMDGEEMGEEASYAPENSGSAVFDGGSDGPRTIKMIVTMPPYLDLGGFADHHGWDGVNAYLDMARRGLEIELDLASKLLPHPNEQVKRLGSLMVCENDDVSRLRREYDRLVATGRVRCEWRDRDDVANIHGRDANFGAGIWLPDDARIDSTAYARALLDAASNMGGAVTVAEDCSPMTSVETIINANDHVDNNDNDDDDDDDDENEDDHCRSHHAEVRLEDGRVLRARHVIVATGGMHLDANLAGLMTPRYSYLVALPHPRRRRSTTTPAGGDGGGMEYPDSPNFFTLGFSHDWCVESDYVRISGEDHFSGLKRPRSDERCRNLAEWGRRKYPYIDPDASYPSRHGVYSETADFLPLVGTTSASRRVCYMVGCNAWGQASLSAVASWAPALLGYRDYRPDEVEGARLCSIGRFVGREVSGSARATRRSRTMNARSRL